ncbi:MAG: oxygen-insensitive NADPH nitroreductase [Gammaproteobacteria bacterium]|nr:oxygen-insensitive NADPH nitroreductase [Gammaproteobacteria bacterium]
MQLMKDHSSVRNFSYWVIDKSLLDNIVQSGQAASSSSFIQAYSVIRVSDQQNRELIANAAGGQSWIISAAEFLLICADMSRIQTCCAKAGVEQLEGYAEHFIAATVDAALMAQNMMLAAESAGLGGVFIGGIRNAPEVVTECLQLPEQVYPVFGLCLGWPTDRQMVKPRLPVDVVLHQDSYQADLVDKQVDEYDEQMQNYYSTRQSNVKTTNWSLQTASAIQGKKREHMLAFLQSQGFLKR